MTFHCFFEQSGIFKNEFKKLGYESYDYDILNDFNETDYIIDLFDEIEKAYYGLNSVFDKISPSDMIISFFPCVRFENQILLCFRGKNSFQKNWSVEKKLEYDLKIHKELSNLYSLITKLAIVCIRKNIPLIIENPYSTQHYLVRYWCIDAKIIDNNRINNGDYYKKPTQYYFINCEPKNNFIFEPLEYLSSKCIAVQSQVNRSMISSQYAYRFIKEYIISDK